MGAWNVGMQYANNSETKVKANELFARYSLSKRTEIYAQTTSLSGAAATVATGGALVASSALGLTALQADPKISAVGIRHTF
jgi:predicted porin